eukprot:jgi/Chlat1/8158/Chrsp76S07615
MALGLATAGGQGFIAVQRKHQQQQQHGGGGVSMWAELPPEILRDILNRVEDDCSDWPARTSFVACAGVCRSWRAAALEVAKAAPIGTTRLTFPEGLRQPGPVHSLMRCYILRDRHNGRKYPTYALYLDQSLLPMSRDEVLAVGGTSSMREPTGRGKFLLSARRRWRSAGIDYVVTLDRTFSDDGCIIGEVRSNVFGTRFTAYEYLSSTSSNCWYMPWKNSGSQQRACATISYDLNWIGTRRPRQLSAVLTAASPVVMTSNGSGSGSGALASIFSPTSPSQPSDIVGVVSSSRPCTEVPLPDAGSAYSRQVVPLDESGLGTDSSTTLHLKNKLPRWHEQSHCWCLDFRGRVTMASVKNFQLVAAHPGEDKPLSGDDGPVLLQFGKVGKDVFTMDYRQPLSAFEAFALCLSSFDTRLLA